MERRTYHKPEETASRNCNFCLSGDREFFASENGFTIVKCRKCGLVMVDPVPSEEYLSGFYSQYHVPHSASMWARYMSAVYDRLFNRELRALPRSSRILDVGCGYGHFLALARQKGFEAYGIEPAGEAADYAEKENRLDIFRGDIKNAPYQDGYFDVITMWFVLEHLADPFSAIEKARRLLKEGGMFILCVPNMDFRGIMKPFGGMDWLGRFLSRTGIKVGTVKFFNMIDPPAHLFGYNKKSLSFALKKAGFGGVRFDIPEDLVHATAASRAVERILNVLAKAVRAIAPSGNIVSNGLIVYAFKTKDIS